MPRYFPVIKDKQRSISAAYLHTALLIYARRSDFLRCRMSYMLTGRMSGTLRSHLFSRYSAESVCSVSEYASSWFPSCLSIVTAHSVLSNTLRDAQKLRICVISRLHNSGFWHIHAKTPRGTAPVDSNFISSRAYGYHAL